MHALANRTTGGDISKLCNDTNAFAISIFTFRSASSTSCNCRTRCARHISIMQASNSIISITEVEHVLMKTDTTKAFGRFKHVTFKSTERLEHFINNKLAFAYIFLI